MERTFKLHIDDILQGSGINLVSRCRFCDSPQPKSSYLFIASEFAQKTWEYFSIGSGVEGPFVQCHQAIHKWWNAESSSRIKPILQAIPSMVCWQIWNKRNKVNHGGYMNWRRVIYGISRNIHFLTMVLYPWLKEIP